MTKLLLKIFVKNHTNTSNDIVRQSYGTLSAVVGIICNTLLSIAKIVVGMVMGLISVLADGINNLTDCGSNVVSIISFRLANKPADKEHPYGHQRIEYVGSMIVGFVVVIIAIQLAIESFGNIISPQPTEFSPVTLIVLGVSVLVKLWMFVFNRHLGRAIDSKLILATSVDSMSDMIATSGVLVALIVGKLLSVNLDGYIGCAVSVVILLAGVNILKDTMNDILGSAPSAELVDDIRSRIMAFDGVHSLHDMEVHNYGANKYFATVHVEMDSNMPSLVMHDIADNIERDFATNTNISLVVHSDPVVLDNDRLNSYKVKLREVVDSIDSRAHAHDIRMVEGVNFTNLIFDIAVPFDCPLDDSEIINSLNQGMAELGETLYLVATVEHQLTAE